MGDVVNRMMISEELFRLVINAIARVSLLNRRFETANGLMQSFLERNEPLQSSLIEALRDLPGLAGDIRMFLRVSDVEGRMHEMRLQLEEALERHCTMRDVVAYVCLEWTQLPPLTARRS